MSSIDKWVLTVASTTIIGGAALMIVPSGKMKKCAEFIVALTVVVSFFAPILSGGVDFDFDLNAIETTADTSEIQSNIDSQVLTYTSQELARELIDCAGAKGCTITEASVTLEVIGDTVTPHSVIIDCGTNESYKSIARSVAYELFGEEIKVEFIR